MRDGLWLLLGCFCPERLKAMESIRISYIDLEHGRIEFPADKVKTKEENERVMPETVRAVSSVWIDNYRALYASVHDYLFFARQGGPVLSGTMSAARSKLTRETQAADGSPQRISQARRT